MPDRHGVLSAIVSAYLGLSTLAGIALLFAPSSSVRDFAVFVAVGRAVARSADPYTPLRLVDPATGVATIVHDASLDPPVSLFLFAPLAFVDPRTAFWVWRAASLALYASLLLWLYRRDPRHATPVRLLWAISLAGLWTTLWEGQIYVPLVLALVVAWTLLEHGRWAPAGLLIGLVVAVKPNVAVWPALLLLAGYGAPALWSALVTLVLSILPALAYGPAVYAEWLGAILGGSSWRANDLNASLIALASRLGLPALGYGLAAALLLGLAVWAHRLRPTVPRLTAFALLASLLASPEALVHYAVFLVPIFLTREWNVPLRIAAAVLACPPLLIVALASAQPTLASMFDLYSLALVLALVGLIREEWRDRPALASL